MAESERGMARMDTATEEGGGDNSLSNQFLWPKPSYSPPPEWWLWVHDSAQLSKPERWRHEKKVKKERNSGREGRGGKWVRERCTRCTKSFIVRLWLFSPSLLLSLPLSTLSLQLPSCFFKSAFFFLLILKRGHFWCVCVWQRGGSPSLSDYCPLFLWDNVRSAEVTTGHSASGWLLWPEPG